MNLVPIRPSERSRYPKDWPAISLAIRHRDGWRCKWCQVPNGARHPETGALVVLTVAHLDHQPENCHADNLVALCQRCHNRYDAPMRRSGRRARLGLLELLLDLVSEPPLGRPGGSDGDG